MCVLGGITRGRERKGGECAESLWRGAVRVMEAGFAAGEVKPKQACRGLSLSQRML